ncbi:hypothetical protein REPUB_Repub08aG0129500 [Reevesia pubescens]
MVMEREMYEVGGGFDEDIIANLDVLELSTNDAVNREVKSPSLVRKVIVDKNIKVGPLGIISSQAWLVRNSVEVHDLE